MNRKVLFFLILTLFFSPNAESKVPEFSFDSSLQGIEYNNKPDIKSFFVIDDHSLHIVSLEGVTEASYEIGENLTGVTYQAGNRNVYMISKQGDIFEFNYDSRQVEGVKPIVDDSLKPLENVEFHGITKKGRYFYAVSETDLYQLRHQKKKNRFLLIKRITTDLENISSIEYSYWRKSFFLSNSSAPVIYQISSEGIEEATHVSDFDEFYSPFANSNGLCIERGRMHFALADGQVRHVWRKTLFSEEYQLDLDELYNPVEEPVEEPAEPILYGFWGLNGYHSQSGLEDIQDRFEATVYQVTSTGPGYTVNTLLPMVRAAGMKVTLNMTGWHGNYSTNGDFDLQKWKDKLSVWKDSGVQEFIDDGTLIGHMILDDIDTFPGRDASADDLEEMARYSKELMPGLMTYVRQKATWLSAPAAGQYEFLDAALNQYRSWDGPADQYAADQAARAMELGLEIIHGLNICDGGDGSSAQAGWRASKYAMTADEIRNYGTALLKTPGLKMFLLWEYDAQEVWPDGTIGANYFDDPEIQKAFLDLGNLAATGGNPLVGIEQ